MKIMVATDGSEYSLKTIDFAVKTAASLNAEVTVLYAIGDVNSKLKGVYRISPDILEMLKENLEKEADEVLEKAADKFRKSSLEVKTMKGTGHPADVICNLAEEGKFDLVIIGRSGLGGVKSFFLGSVSNRVAQSIKTNLLIVKQQ